jgi:hypothetical protein
MASSEVSARPRRSAAPLDLGLAAFAAGAVAFATWAMPASLFGDLVAATGLANFVAAAQPPLGETARLAAIGAGAFITFAFVWLLLRALDRRPQPHAVLPVVEEDEEEELFAAPRVRRNDAHPDAPAPRPLFAGRDLGEPLELQKVVPEAPAEDPHQLPAWMVAEEESPEPDFVAEPEPRIEAEPILAEPEVEEVEAEKLPELAQEGPVQEEPVQEEAPWPVEAEEEEPLREEQSISRLMARLEGGLDRKFGHAEPRPAEPIIPVVAPDAAGHKLRSALADLQKLSHRA